MSKKPAKPKKKTQPKRPQKVIRSAPSIIFPDDEYIARWLAKS